MDKISYEKLTAINRSLRGLRHEVANNLNGITGFAEVMELKSKGVPGFSDYCFRIINSCGKINTLVDGITRYSNPRLKKTTELDVHRVIDKAVSLLAFSLGEGITVEAFPGAEYPYIGGDEPALLSLLLEFGKNAGAVLVEGDSLTLETSNVILDETACTAASVPLVPGSYIAIRIADTGPGIHREALGQIFDPFYTTSGDSTRGQGLTRIAFQILEMGGDIDVVSEPEAGTVFTLLLPNLLTRR